MSAVLDISRATTARATVGDKPSCLHCRHHRMSGDVMYCSQPRSPAVGGVVVVSVQAARQAKDLERLTGDMAHHCKYYQEEQ